MGFKGSETFMWQKASNRLNEKDRFKLCDTDSNTSLSLNRHEHPFPDSKEEGKQWILTARIIQRNRSGITRRSQQTWLEKVLGKQETTFKRKNRFIPIVLNALHLFVCLSNDWLWEQTSESKSNSSERKAAVESGSWKKEVEKKMSWRSCVERKVPEIFCTLYSLLSMSLSSSRCVTTRYTVKSSPSLLVSHSSLFLIHEKWCQAERHTAQPSL